MASSSSIIQQKIKESVGLSQVTRDADLAPAVIRLGELERDVALLRKVLQTSNRAVVEAAAAAKAQQVAIMCDLAVKVVGTEGAEYYEHYKRVHAYMDVELPTKLNASFETVVLSRLDEWTQALGAVRADVKTCEEKRVVMDHYRDKVEHLQNAKRNAQMKGKVVSKAEDEKLARNEEKLASALAEYSGARDKAVGHLLHAFDGASNHLNNVLLRVMQYETQLAKDTFTATKAFDPYVAQLLGRLKDRQLAGDAVNHMESCIRYAREERERGRALDFSTITSAVGISNAAAGTAPMPRISATSSSSAAAAAGAGDDDGGAVPSFLSAKPSGYAGGAPAAQQRRGGSSGSGSFSEDAPAVPPRRSATAAPAAAAALTPAVAPSAPPALTRSPSNPFGSAFDEPSEPSGSSAVAGAGTAAAASAPPGSPDGSDLREHPGGGGGGGGGAGGSAAIAALRGRFKGLFGGGGGGGAAAAGAAAPGAGNPFPAVEEPQQPQPQRKRSGAGAATTPAVAPVSVAPSAPPAAATPAGSGGSAWDDFGGGGSNSNSSSSSSGSSGGGNNNWAALKSDVTAAAAVAGVAGSGSSGIRALGATATAARGAASFDPFGSAASAVAEDPTSVTPIASGLATVAKARALGSGLPPAGPQRRRPGPGSGTVSAPAPADPFAAPVAAPGGAGGNTFGDWASFDAAPPPPAAAAAAPAGLQPPPPQPGRSGGGGGGFDPFEGL